jgi:hypothetical protein
MYACSPKWPTDWISEEDATQILAQLVGTVLRHTWFPGQVSLNEGIHFTGGEPFLNFDLLLRLTEIAQQLGFPSTFVETNGFWCEDDQLAREKLHTLKQAGLGGIMISANPCLLEQVPFERTERAARMSEEVFGPNAFTYQQFFFAQFQALGLEGTLPLKEYLAKAGYGLEHVELIANGRVPFKLGYLFRQHPASHFFGASCQPELLRNWHVHVDNYGNFVPGFCGGLSWGNARELDDICQEGVDLGDRPVLRALLTDLEGLVHLGLELGYKERDGYVSKCHLCADIRRHLVQHGDFIELQPRQFYERLEDGYPFS